MSETVAQEPASGTPDAQMTPATPGQVQVREVCPLCSAPLRCEQDWCMRCGAAARTRLAAPPKWKLLVAALATLVLLSLGVLIAALLELAG